VMPRSFRQFSLPEAAKSLWQLFVHLPLILVILQVLQRE
jgi:hypothetical protein